MRETWEEAGVKGVITRHIGVFAEKSKTGVKAHHWIYEMEIKEVTKKFPEQGKRQRRWVSVHLLKKETVGTYHDFFQQFDYEEAMLAVKAHYIHDALSMSSLSPLIHEDEGKKKKKKKKKVDDESPENSDNEEDKKKKKKEKKKKDKERDPIDETLSFNDESDIEKSKKEKKKDNMKSSKKEDDDSIEEVQVDEPLEKKNKKKGKKKNKGEAGTEIIELSDKDIPKFSTENNPSIVVTDDVDQLNQQINAVTIDVPPVSEQHSLKEQVYPAKKQNNFTENTPPVEYEQQLPRPQEPPSNPHYPSK